MADEAQAAEAPAETAVADDAGEPTPAETPEAKEGELPEVAQDGQPAEGDKPPEPETDEDKAKAAEAVKAEENLRAAALRWANKTMAAARRAEQRSEAVKAKNEQLTAEVAQARQHVEQYQGFVEGLRKGDASQLRRIGFRDFKHFVETVRDFGGEPAPPTADDRVSALENQLKAERDQRAQAQRDRAIEESKAAVKNGITALVGTRYGHAATRVGLAEVWEGIEAYHQKYGDVPDEAVLMIADEVEKSLAEEFGVHPKISAQQQAKKAAPTPASAAPGARTSGARTLDNRDRAGAPSKREYSMDPDERRKQVTEDMRAAGEL